MVKKIIVALLLSIGLFTYTPQLLLAKEEGQQEMEYKKIYLAGGCFWGVEEYFSRINGVIDSISGYANGRTKNPSYQQVITGTTYFAETVEVTYDPRVVSLETLLTQYFKIIDPTSIYKQGNDVGTQYRTGVYYVDPNDQEVINKVFAKQREIYGDKLVVENTKLTSFYVAEEYHQDYLKKNPNGYCHINFDSLKDLDNPDYILNSLNQADKK